MNRLNHFILIGSLVAAFGTYAQNVGINTTGAVPNASAGLDVDFSNKGLLVPRVALTGTTNNAPIGASIATSLLVYNTATTGDVTPGYYYWGGSNWIRFSGDGDAWRTTGNAGTNTTSNFIGTTDNVGLRVRTNNANRFEFTNNGHLRAFDNGTADQPTYSWNGASGGQTMGMYRIGANILGFSTNGTERMRILDNGNTGIGNNNPSQRLSVTGNFRLDGAFMPGNTAGTANQLLMSAGAGNSPTWTNFTIGNPSSISVIGKWFSSLSWSGTWSNGGLLTFTILDPDCTTGSNINVSINGPWNALFSGITIRNVVAENGQFRVSVVNNTGLGLTGAIPITWFAAY